MFDRFSKALVDLFWSNPDALRKPDARPGKAGQPGRKSVSISRQNQPKVMTPQRAELIRNAIRIHRAKKQILAHLSDEQREKLMAMAMRAFLNEASGAANAKQGQPAAPKDPAQKSTALSPKPDRQKT